MDPTTPAPTSSVPALHTPQIQPVAGRASEPLAQVGSETNPSGGCSTGRPEVGLAPTAIRPEVGLPRLAPPWGGTWRKVPSSSRRRAFESLETSSSSSLSAGEKTNLSEPSSTREGDNTVKTNTFTHKRKRIAVAKKDYEHEDEGMGEEKIEQDHPEAGHAIRAVLRLEQPGDPLEEDNGDTVSTKEKKRFKRGESASTGRKPGHAESIYAKVKRTDVDKWLRNTRVPLSRDHAISEFLKWHTQPSRHVFLNLVPSTADDIMSMWRHVQKSVQWLRARFPRKTGSDGGSLLDWNPYCNALKHVWKKIYDKFLEVEATMHGNTYEKPAGKVYLDAFQRELNRWYVEQRSFETGVIHVFGRRIPLIKRNPQSPYFSPPRARMWHIGMVVDPLNQWRGLSIDGLVTIEGVPLIVVEIKCPFSSGTMVLYPNEPMYYIPQGQDGMYIMWRLYPSIVAIHRATYSPLHGLNVDLFAIDPGWYLNWYAPRELRYYFEPLIQTLTEHVVFRFRAEAKPTMSARKGGSSTQSSVDPAAFQAFVSREYGMACSTEQVRPEVGHASEPAV